MLIQRFRHFDHDQLGNYHHHGSDSENNYVTGSVKTLHTQELAMHSDSIGQVNWSAFLELVHFIDPVNESHKYKNGTYKWYQFGGWDLKLLPFLDKHLLGLVAV